MRRGGSSSNWHARKEGRNEDRHRRRRCRRAGACLLAPHHGHEPVLIEKAPAFAAFARYEERVWSFLAAEQATACKFASSFVSGADFGAA